MSVAAAVPGSEEVRARCLSTGAASARGERRRLAALAAPALVLIASFCPPPALGLDAERALTQYVHDQWTAREGAPSGTVTAIARGKDGYLWLGTRSEGLIRFDGLHFSRVEAVDRAFGLTGYPITSLLATRDGALWVAGQPGVARLKERRWTVVGGSGQRKDAGALCEADDGSVWFARELVGVAVVRNEQVTEVPTSGAKVRAIACRGGEIWLGTMQGIARLEGTTVTWLSRGTRHEEWINVLDRDERGLWVGTRHGLVRREEARVAARLTRRQGLRSDDVTVAVHDRTRSFWIGTGVGGLQRLREGRLESFSPPAELGVIEVTALHEDPEGSLWVGTRRGLHRLKDGLIRAWGPAEGLVHPNVTSLLEGRDGGLWAFSDGGGLSRIKDGRVERSTARQGLASDFGGPLFESRDGSLWIGHDRGLTRLKDGVARIYREGELGQRYVSTIVEDAEGLIVYVHDSGLCRLRDGRLAPYRLRDGSPLATGFVYSSHMARDGTLWLATVRGAVAIRDGRARQIDLPWPARIVISIHEDAAGTIWLGTWGGLVRVAGERWTLSTAADGLFHDRIFSVLEDRDGYLWMSCPRGIFRVRKQEIEDRAAGRTTAVRSEAFGVADGMRTSEAQGVAQPAGWAARDGTLWFATPQGAISVDPRRLRRRAVLPSSPVLVEEVRADAELLDPSAGLELGPGVRRLEIRYNALSLLAPEKTRFRFKLEGVDEDWVEAGNRRTAQYTRLAPGSYTFRVVASDPGGTWRGPEASLRFKKRAYFYQTRWFLALSIVVPLLALWAGYRARFRLLQARDRELSRKIEEAVARIRTLQGLLPICAWCKKVRDDQGYWTQLEVYLTEHTEAELSHGICPDCIPRLRGSAASEGRDPPRPR